MARYLCRLRDRLKTELFDVLCPPTRRGFPRKTLWYTGLALAPGGTGPDRICQWVVVAGVVYAQQRNSGT